jgi:phosphohistidine swiveling domain-containing protein
MTSASGYNPKTGEYNDSLTGDYLWSSVNTREAAPDVATPYTWSALRYGFRQMSMLPSHLPIGNICGRVYNNASVGATVFQVLGQGKNSFDATSKELYGIDSSDISEWNVPLVPASPWERVLVLRNVLRVMVKVRKAEKSIKTFLKTNPDWCETQKSRLSSLDKAELIHWSEDTFLPYVDRCFWWMIGSAMAQSNAVSKLRGDLVQIVGPDETIALLSNVSTDDEILASLGIVVGLDRLRRGQINREEYIKRYGHRGPHEAELSIPRPAENPDWIDEQLGLLKHSTIDVDTLLQEQQARYEAALKNLSKNVLRKFDSLVQRLQEAARLTRVREMARSEGIRTFAVARSFALRAGALCDLGEDAFFLEHEEILHLLAGKKNWITQISVRKSAYHKFLALPQYPTIIMGSFNPFEWSADPNRQTDIYDTTGRIKKQFTTQIKGMPGSAGQAEGRVRIVNSPEDGDQLQPGEILVAVTTNVGWTSIFPRVVAVITDVGAPLSHAAIVARELGIPAVVGCFNATTVLKTGDRVRVDGGTGTVTIL